MTAPSPDSLLLELAVPFRRIGDALFIEAQAHNGVERWLENFKSVTICAPVIPETLVDDIMSWKSVETIDGLDRLKVEVLPWGYHPLQHFTLQRQVRSLFRSLIPRHEFLCFSNLGWLGAWGNTAADEAVRQRRQYSVWLDWVLHEMPAPKGQNVARLLYGKVIRSMVKRNSLRAIRAAKLGLFHGQTVYDAYAPISGDPQVVHDIHLKTSDIIDIESLDSRISPSSRPLRIGYVGRVHEMKGPMEWIESLGLARRGNEKHKAFRATWIGDGPLLNDARNRVTAENLDDKVFFPGSESDRSKVLEFLRSLDLFVFCHSTPESPRCLIEALMSGVPLVGFKSSYAEELVSRSGGGHFVPIGDVSGLARLIEQFLDDDHLRARTSRQARSAGKEFSDVGVFRHRSDLIKTRTTCRTNSYQATAFRFQT